MSDAYGKFVQAVHLAQMLSALALVLILSAAGLWLRWDLKDLHPAATDLPRVVRITGGAATDLEKTLKIERDAATNQINATAAMQQKITLAMDNFAGLMKHTDDSLNGTAGVLPTISSAVHDQNAKMLELEDQAKENLADLDTAEKQLTALLTNATNATKSAADLAADPEIHAALVKLDAAMDKTNEFLAHLDSIGASGDRQMQLIEAKLREALKPASLLKTIFTRSLGLAGPAAQVATATKR